MRKQAKPTPGHPVLLDDTVLVRTACMPLRVSPEQDAILKELQAEFNLACNRASHRDYGYDKLRPLGRSS